MKKQITLRIDEEVLDWFKSQGKGYQSRINDVLRDYVDGWADIVELGKSIESGPVEMIAFTHGGDIDFNGENFFKPMPKK